jgi:hypothetical protein
MGGYFSSYQPSDASEVPHSLAVSKSDQDVNFDHFDDISKEELINYIKLLKPKNITLPDNFVDKMKDIELENTQLIPMCIELYQKMIDLFGEFKGQKKVESVTKKKQFFVRPKFTSEDVKKSIEGPVVNINTDLNETLINVPAPNVLMKNDDVTDSEYTSAFAQNTPVKKDMMGINKKLLKDMPQYLRTRFVNVFNQIMKDLSRVDKLSVGKASYIYKANKHGSTSDINSFRQIVSIPNSVNQLHRILGIRLANYFQANNYIDSSIQKGSVGGQKFSIFEQFYKVKSVLKHANKNKKSCAVLFLDISNAFGNLHLEHLYKILKIYNVDNNFIEYLKEFYNRFQYYVDTNDIKTGTFKWKDGLIQGCSLSPLLFVFALNYVLTYLDKEYKNLCGYAISDTLKILLTAFVDDICIICKDVVSLEAVYKKLSESLKMLGLPINKSKCAIMVVNDPTATSGDLSQIQKVNVFKYLGEYISSDGSSTESYVQFLKGASRRLIGLDNRKIENKFKIEIFNKCMLPWIQRKMLAMYDISATNRLKIVSIIKPYFEKWGHSDLINIFSNVSTILNDSKDNIIANANFENEDFDEVLQNDVELANYVLKDSNVKISYNEIDDEFKLDLEMDALEELADYDSL